MGRVKRGAAAVPGKTCCGVRGDWREKRTRPGLVGLGRTRGDVGGGEEFPGVPGGGGAAAEVDDEAADGAVPTGEIGFKEGPVFPVPRLRGDEGAEAEVAEVRPGEGGKDLVADRRRGGRGGRLDADAEGKGAGGRPFSAAGL